MTTKLPHFAPRRQLGKTGFVATAVGIGDLSDRRIGLAECIATVHRAMDTGLNVIDTAPQYEKGYGEEIVGAALKGRREGMFLIDKVDYFDRPVAGQIEGSLGRLGLEYADAFLFHAVPDVGVWARIAAPGGLMDELEVCRKQGKLRFRGVSSHSPDVVQAALDSGLCDVAMFAIGPFCDPRYVNELLPLARRMGVGTVCIKTFGAGKLLCDTSGYGQPLQERPRGKVSSGGQDNTPLLPHLSVRDCVHYTLTCDPDVALLGMSFPNEQDAALLAAGDFTPADEQRMADIRARAALAMEGKGAAWW